MPEVDGGSYWELPSGKLRAQVYRKNHKAPTKKIRWQQTCRNLTAVRKWVKQVNDDLDAHLDPDRPRVEEEPTLTVGEWWARWWPVRCQAGISPRYKEEMERRWRLHVMPRWADVPLDGEGGVTSEDVQTWVNELARGNSPVYVEDIYKTLATIMTAAVDRRPRLIEYTPCHKIKLPEKVLRKRVTTDEDGILSIAHRCGTFEIMVVVAGYTGLRPEEFAGILRQDADLRDHPYLPPAGPRVDVLRKLLRIPYADGALIEFPGGRIEQGPLKNRVSERIVRVPPFLAELLAAQLASHDGDYLFVGPRGGVMRRSTFESRFWRPACDGRPAKGKTRGRAAAEGWTAICKGLELRGVRHTHKKILQTEGIPDFAIEARLGHANKGISGVYSHVAEEVEDRICRVLQQRWERSLARELERAERAKRALEAARFEALAVVSGVAST